MSYSGNVLHVFTGMTFTEFLAANVSTCNQYLYMAASDACCVVFDISARVLRKLYVHLQRSIVVDGVGRLVRLVA